MEIADNVLRHSLRKSVAADYFANYARGMIAQDASQLRVQLREAGEADKQWLCGLHQLYLHDLSEFTENLHVTADGSFESDDIDTFYSIDALVPLIIEAEGQAVGFILLNTPPYAKGDYHINDFFILRSQRRRGLGQLAIAALAEARPGQYSVAELTQNLPAINFWRGTLSRLGIAYEEQQVMDGDDACLVQRFNAA